MRKLVQTSASNDIQSREICYITALDSESRAVATGVYQYYHQCFMTIIIAIEMECINFFVAIEASSVQGIAIRWISNFRTTILNLQELFFAGPIDFTLHSTYNLV
jgi:hypothetical protein